jgi:hypothetical protein
MTPLFLAFSGLAFVAVMWYMARLEKTGELKRLVKSQDKLIVEIEAVARENRDLDMTALTVYDLIATHKRKELL